MERVEQRTTTTTSAGGSTITPGATSGGVASSTSYSESQREIQQLKERGLYRGHGADIADRRAETRVEQYVKEDAPVVEEQVRRREIHEVIPKVQRERELTEIRHAVLPIHDRVREERTVSERELAGYEERDYRERLREEEMRKNRAIRDRLSRGYRQELDTEVEYRYAKPTVEEVVKPRVIHEIHPVIQREVQKEHMEREYLPIRERIIEGPRVADDVEVLRPLTRDEWERTHGRAMYEKSGWMYGAPAEEYVTREYSRYEIDDRSGAPALPPRGVGRVATPTRGFADERRSSSYVEERGGGAYDMSGVARALEPEYRDVDRRGRYDSGYMSPGYASPAGGYATPSRSTVEYTEPRHRHSLFSRHKSGSSSRRHLY